MKRRLHTKFGVAIGLAALLGVATAGPASAAVNEHAVPHPLTAQAMAAGLTQGGGGRPGWENRSAAAPSAAPSTVASPNVAEVEGIDVSAYQGNVDWASYWNQGKRWAYTKASEGNYYTNPYFAQQYTGSYNQGFIRGAYHFATPNDTSGAVQAQYFVAHGGGWSADGKTLPGMLDIEYNPYGATCYGLSQASMVNWIADFLNTYKGLTGRDAVIYSTLDWWTTCTGNSGAFGASKPLWIARYASSAGTLPAGWQYYTFWQYASSPVDSDQFNGAIDRLQALARG
ncbi:MAG: lysozyme [Actinomycetota bacterium]|nr:lysozyme [Actinomycetota bacterium]